ncbi:MAG: TonB-dependent receptor plug domain-containing protein [Acidobacteria bacterium]|nr:TonB-dependent receptor plug domain-containing protein [Acidobacteriota bacterium]
MLKLNLSVGDGVAQNPFRRGWFALLSGLVLLITVGLVLSPANLSAQTGTTGQIAGSVNDQNGAVVPDATITALHLETGAKRTLVTSADGNYSIVNLAIGTYRLTITKTGFKETSVSNVVVNVSNITRQDVTLETGAVSEVVNITADSIQIETQSGTVGEVISGEQVRELPINGRSFTQLTQLQPGVSAANNFDSKQKGLFGGVDFSVNGNSGQSNLFLTDGANNNDTGSNRTILLFPSIEAIAEFRSLRNSYGPEYGQAAGAVISIATRGGSNTFHGSAFYFGRNDKLNATEFFTNKNGLKKDKLRRNDFGFSLGGPIVKDRLFFFYSQEWNKEIRGKTRTGFVPTAAQRGGDFSTVKLVNGVPCVPAIGGGRPGSTNQIIPAASLNAAGLALVKIFPLPNVTSSTSCNNWAFSANSPINFREENIRIDYNLTSKNKIFGRYTQDDWANGYPTLNGSLWGDDAFPTIESSWTQPSKQAAVKLTTQLTATAINDIQFSYSANRINVDPGAGADLNADINTKIPGLFPTSGKVNGNNRPHPVFWGGIAPFNSSSGPDLWTQSPFRNSLDIYTVRDDFSMVKGNHTLKMGFLYDTAAKNEDSGPNNEATQFWGACCGNNSGNALADVLTNGSLFGFSETNTMPIGQNRYKNLEFYFGDTWKAKPNLTLELGARYSLLYEPTDKRDLISGFSPAAYNPSRPATDPCNGLVVPKGTNPCAGIAGASTPVEFSNRSLRENNYKNLAPRIGVAWDVFSDGKTAIRGGFGTFYLRERTSPYFAALTTNSPFAISNGGQRTLDGTVFTGLGAASAGSPRFGLSPEAATPYSLQFNFSVGQQLWKETVVEVGYVGNRARKQLTHNDVNQVKQANQKAAAFAADGNAVNAFRPYSNYGSIYQFERNGKAYYDSLQVLFRTRFAKSFNLQAAYTFSKSKADFGLNDSSGSSSAFAVLDRNNRGLDFAESDINRPHIFVANMIYNLPTFKGSNPFVRTVLGGWEFTSIVQISSGTSLTPQLFATGIQGVGLSQSFQAGITGTGTGVANQRPIRVESEPCTLEGTKGSYFNPRAWTLVGYKIGETIPKKSTCAGPGTKNVDFSVYKNFSPSWLKSSFLGEAARVQFRLEFFNAFNTVQFGGGSLPVNFYNGTVTCGANPCSITNNTITAFSGAAGNFGVAQSTKGGREIQYALKLNF